MNVHIWCRMNEKKITHFLNQISHQRYDSHRCISSRMEHYLRFLTSVKQCLDSLPVKQRTSFALKGSLTPHTQENFTKCRVWRNQTIISVLIIKTIERPWIGFVTIFAIERNHDFSGLSGRARYNFFAFHKDPRSCDHIAIEGFVFQRLSEPVLFWVR